MAARAGLKICTIDARVTISALVRDVSTDAHIIQVTPPNTDRCLALAVEAGDDGYILDVHPNAGAIGSNVSARWVEGAARSAAKSARKAMGTAVAGVTKESRQAFARLGTHRLIVQGGGKLGAQFATGGRLDGWTVIGASRAREVGALLRGEEGDEVYESHR